MTLFELYFFASLEHFFRLVADAGVALGVLDRSGSLFVQKDLIFNQSLLIGFLVVLDFLFDFVEEVGVDDSLVTGSVGLLLKLVDLGDFLVVLVQDLLDVILDLLDLLLDAARHKLL